MDKSVYQLFYGKPIVILQYVLESKAHYHVKQR